jgi:hypothetical protein
MLADTFGVQNNGSDVSLPMAKLSFLYDTYMDMPIDVQLDHKNTSERDLAVKHLAQTEDNDLILYDRGYYAYWFVLLHFSQGREFCFRLKSNANTQVKEFIKSGKKQAVISLVGTEGMQQKAQIRNLEIRDMKVRLIRIKTSKGVYVLMTSLTDTQGYPAKDFYDLYHLRWRVEEGYKKQKAFLDVENFSGRTVHSIKQDVHASALIQTLVAMECFASKNSIQSKVKARKYGYKINFSNAIQSFRRSIIAILSGQLDMTDIYLRLKALARNLTIIKPDRSFAREKVRCRRQSCRKGYK